MQMARDWSLSAPTQPAIKMTDPVALYDSAYGNFATDVLSAVRREAFGADIGQNSWLTVDEYLRFFEWLALQPASNVLEIACGSGGPALFMARTMRCHITGIDNNENGIATANRMSKEQGLASMVRFQHADASEALPFDDKAFDSIVCIDAMNHLPNRPRVFAEWHRVLKPEGRILFTDPITVTGSLSNEEIAIRSSIGYFLFAPVGANERFLKEAGFELIRCEDVTDNEVTVSKRWHDARAKRKDDLIKIEGEKTYAALQQFLSVVYTLSSERRLSRFVFVAQKTV
jgi:cyclopropane fatty-acyl-phospholipid synthase-like methyltransferase